MRYPVAIEPGTKTEAFGVVVPDLPGCFSAGDTMEEAMAKAEEAIAAWIETALDTGYWVLGTGYWAGCSSAVQRRGLAQEAQGMEDVGLGRHQGGPRGA